MAEWQTENPRWLGGGGDGDDGGGSISVHGAPESPPPSLTLPLQERGYIGYGLLMELGKAALVFSYISPV